MANKSDQLRDLLADHLIDAIQNPDKDDDGNPVGIDPRLLSVARQFVKDNPPEDLPTPESSAGLLEGVLEGSLPFAVEAGQA